jgi:hypothetical protein
MSSTREGTVNAILDKLFVNGMGQRADRMVLVQEDYSGRATVSDARDLGGWGRLPVRDLLLAALQHREQEVRAKERDRCASLAEVMAAGETYGTGRQKALNIAAAIRDSQQEGDG